MQTILLFAFSWPVLKDRNYNNQKSLKLARNKKNLPHTRKVIADKNPIMEKTVNFRISKVSLKCKHPLNFTKLKRHVNIKIYFL